MVAESIVAYLHYVSVLGVAGVLTAELLMYRREMTPATARMIRKIDSFYGLSAAGVVVTGLLRVYWVGKGYAFYHHNPFFHALWITFVVVGLLSIVPTMHFIRWGKAPNDGHAPSISEATYKKMHRILMAEVHLVAIMPLLAVLMARGVGN
jgi:putative membrane protein